MSNDLLYEPVKIIGGPQPESPSTARRTYSRIQERIREFLELKTVKSGQLRDAVVALNVLPVNEAADDCWYGVRPDGDVLLFCARSPHDSQEVEDEWTRTAILTQGAESYPELEALVPPPPLSCRTCPRCHGSGLIRKRGADISCICGGLGWLPPVEDKAPPSPAGKSELKESQ